MKQRVVILGGGTGGTLVANRLRRVTAPDQLEIVVVDLDDRHVYQPGLLFVPFGLTHPEDIVRPRARQLRSGITFVNSAIDRVEVGLSEVHLNDGQVLAYDVLVVATGAVLAPEETEGLTGPGWMKNVFTFYTPEGAGALEAALATFDGGRLVVNVVDMPIKCPVAPLEFCFLADWYFRERGIRDLVELVLRHATGRRVHQTDRVRNSWVRCSTTRASSWSPSSTLPKSTASAEVSCVSTAAKSTSILAVVIPVHCGAAYVGRSVGLGDALELRADRQALACNPSPRPTSS